jgi:hypothetical protein
MRTGEFIADLIAIGYLDETIAKAAAGEAPRLAQDSDHPAGRDRGDGAGQREQLPRPHQPSPGRRRGELGHVGPDELGGTRTANANGVRDLIGNGETDRNVDHAVGAQTAARKEAAVQTCDQPALGWTVVLRRQPARIVEGRPEGGYTSAFELICCDCGDHPDLDYRDISPELQRIRGPYPIAAGVAAYKKHLELRHRRQPTHQAGGSAHDSSS